MITEDLVKSDLHPTPEQFDWLATRLDELTNTLKERGETHILDLKTEHYVFSLRIKGGKGYTKKFLDQDWSIIDFSFPSDHPIPELKDRVITHSDTVQVLSVNQRTMALEIEKQMRNSLKSTIKSRVQFTRMVRG